MGFEKNSIHTLKIDSYNSEGEGVGRLDNYVIFVKGALAGETVEVKLIKVAKTYAYARLLKVIERVNNRIEPDCEFSSACGGCSLRHMNYEEELKFKLNKVNDAFARIGKIDYQVKNIIGASSVDRYRNKAIFPVSENKDGGVSIGLFQNRSHNVIDIQKCLIQSVQAEAFIGIVMKWMESNKISAYNEEKQTGTLRNIFIRTNYLDETLLCLVSRTDIIPHVDKLIKGVKSSNLNCVGIVQCINNKNTNVVLSNKYKLLYGDSYIQDKVCDLLFNLSVPSFFQVNRDQAETLYNCALDFAEVDNTDVVLDLYCGTGTISLLFAKNSKKVIAADIVKEAILNAKENAKINNIANVDFVCSDAGKLASKLVKDEVKPNIICVDPPRKGIDEKTIKAIVEIEPDKLIYISCNPSSLARDLSTLLNNGFKIFKSKAVDMFPRTTHVESIVLMQK